MERWKNGRLKRTIKEGRQFDTKKPEELESEFDKFDADNSCPFLPFKGFRFPVQNSYLMGV